MLSSLHSTLNKQGTYDTANNGLRASNATPLSDILPGRVRKYAVEFVELAPQL